MFKLRQWLLGGTVVVLLGGCTRDRIDGLSLDLEADPIDVAALATAQAELTPAREAPPKPLTYIVEAGDTLADIAIRHGTSIAAIQNLNPQLVSDQLFPGDELLVPAGAAPAEAAEEESVAPPAADARFYVVEEGDIVSALATEFGVTVADIKDANPLVALDRIAVGQRLVIPEATVLPEPEDENALYHTVRTGETLNGIAAAYGVDPLQIARLNNLREPDELAINQRLKLPDDAALVLPEEAPPPGAGVTHIVQAGETLSSIALYYEVSVLTLVQANSLADEDQLDAGQALFIPGVEAPPAAPAESAPVGLTHVVQAGETLSSLALLYQVSVGALVQANSLTDEDALALGQELFIPGVETPPAAPAEAAPVGLTHVVQAGETLSSLALLYQVSVGALVQANSLTDEDALALGQELFVPGVEAPPAAPAATTDEPPTVVGVTHIVRAGETLSSIALDYGVSVADLVQANDLRDEDALALGQELFVPGVETPPAAPAATTDEPPTVVGVTHIVRAGETLSSIALDYGVSVADLVQANDLRDEDALALGQELFVPGVETPPAAPAATTDEPPTVVGVTHIVRAGETLSSIALDYEVSVADLVQANNLRDEDALALGQELFVPGVVAKTKDGLRVHVVRAGETLHVLAERYGVETEALKALNDLPDSDRIDVGQELLIPPPPTDP